jgi:hypothetical protein
VFDLSDAETDGLILPMMCIKSQTGGYSRALFAIHTTNRYIVPTIVAHRGTEGEMGFGHINLRAKENTSIVAQGFVESFWLGDEQPPSSVM